MTDDATNEARYKRFATKPYVVPDGRTPEQIERDQRLLQDVKRLQARRRAGDVDPRDRVIAAVSFAPKREPTQTYAQALQGRAEVDYLPSMRCATCGQMPFWNGFTYDDNHDPVAHGVLSESARLDVAIARVNRAQPLSEISIPRLVRGDDDD